MFAYVLVFSVALCLCC